MFAEVDHLAGVSQGDVLSRDGDDFFCRKSISLPFPALGLFLPRPALSQHLSKYLSACLPAPACLPTRQKRRNFRGRTGLWISPRRDEQARSSHTREVREGASYLRRFVNVAPFALNGRGMRVHLAKFHALRSSQNFLDADKQTGISNVTRWQVRERPRGREGHSIPLINSWEETGGSENTPADIWHWLLPQLFGDLAQINRSYTVRTIQRRRISPSLSFPSPFAALIKPSHLSLARAAVNDRRGNHLPFAGKRRKRLLGAKRESGFFGVIPSNSLPIIDETVVRRRPPD